MDDINSMISSILGDPVKMQQLRSVAESMGINTGSAPAPAPNNTNNNTGQGPGGIDPGAIASILQNFQNMGGNSSGAPSANPTSASSMMNLDGVSKIANLMSTYNQSDKNVDLLRSLKPHFSSARAGRIDDAVRIMQLMKMWPGLRDSGILGSIGNIFTGGGGR